MSSPVEANAAAAHAATAPSTPTTRRLLLECLLVSLLAAALTAHFLVPDLATLRHHLPADLGDPVLILYIFDWGSEALSNGGEDFWDPPFFYPTRGVGALADTLPGPMLAYLGLTRGLGLGSVASYNTLFLLSFVGAALSLFLVARRSGSRLVPAIVAGCIFAFNPYRWDQVSHLQVLLTLFLPLTLWTSFRLLQAPSLRRAVTFLLFYSLHLSGGLYLAYYMHLMLAIVLAVAAVERPARERLRRSGVLLGITGLVAAMISVAVFLPYARRSAALDLHRGPSEIRAFSATALSFATVNEERSPRYPEILSLVDRVENALFPGIVATGLAFAAVATLPVAAPVLALGALYTADLVTFGGTDQGAHYGPYALGGYSFSVALLALAAGIWLASLRRRGSRPRRRFAELDPWRRTILAIAVSAIALTLPVVVFPLGLVVPGLDAMRVPTRVYPFALFAIALWSADGLQRILDRLRSPAAATTIVGLLAVIFVWENEPQLDWPRLPEKEGFPAVFTWLGENDAVRAIAHYPANIGHYEVKRMYFSLLHGKPIVNGYSGKEPPGYKDRIGRDPLPTRETVEGLREIGVTHVVADTRYRKGWAWRKTVRDWHRRTLDVGLEHVASLDLYRVYRICDTAPCNPEPAND